MSNTNQTHTHSAAPAAFIEAPPSQVQQWLRSGEAVLLDVREADEHIREHINGSHLLPITRFDPAQAAALARPGQKIILHCRGGARSTDACRMAVSLAGSGVTIVNMTGGIEAWKAAGLPVQLNASASRISVLRQVQLVIGVCTLIGTALAWFVDLRFVAIPAFFGAGLTFAGATGTCGLASLLSVMPWNRVRGSKAACASTGSK